mmetsp:Transcript_25878/g.40163  ORF Transcript_25878/g.40163 Transcript_25878/m.40163 type:complete len:116 (-) Transcript_25878:491-838(-)
MRQTPIPCTMRKITANILRQNSRTWPILTKQATPNGSITLHKNEYIKRLTMQASNTNCLASIYSFSARRDTMDGNVATRFSHVRHLRGLQKLQVSVYDADIFPPLFPELDRVIPP